MHTLYLVVLVYPKLEAIGVVTRTFDGLLRTRSSAGFQMSKRWTIVHALFIHSKRGCKPLIAKIPAKRSTRTLLPLFHPRLYPLFRDDRGYRFGHVVAAGRVGNGGVPFDNYGGRFRCRRGNNKG